MTAYKDRYPTGIKYRSADGDVAWMVTAYDGHRTFTKGADDDGPLTVFATYCPGDVLDCRCGGPPRRCVIRSREEDGEWRITRTGQRSPSPQTAAPGPAKGRGPWLTPSRRCHNFWELGAPIVPGVHVLSALRSTTSPWAHRCHNAELAQSHCCPLGLIAPGPSC
jgi:hypothetical protein